MHFPAVIISSRPEGVTDKDGEVGSKYKREGFEVISLKPLSEQQAVAAVEKQLRDDEYFGKLQHIKKIRTEHDALYKTKVRDAGGGSASVMLQHLCLAVTLPAHVWRLLHPWQYWRVMSHAVPSII